MRSCAAGALADDGEANGAWSVSVLCGCLREASPDRACAGVLAGCLLPQVPELMGSLLNAHGLASLVQLRHRCEERFGLASPVKLLLD